MSPLMMFSSRFVAVGGQGERLYESAKDLAHNKGAFVQASG